jgi:hypothetical protein
MATTKQQRPGELPKDDEIFLKGRWQLSDATGITKERGAAC